MLFRRNKRNEHHADFPALGSTSYRSILAAIENHLRPQWYLEIGSRSGDSLARIKTNFIAIDPEFAIRSTSVFNKAEAMLFFQQKSDDFFDSAFLERSGIQPQMAFIDGLHWFEFALRDFMNLERTMDRNGVICIHDVCPFNYEMTTRDLDYLKTGRAWTGDVWKTIAILIEKRADLEIKILDADRTGIAVISNLNPDSQTLAQAYEEVFEAYKDIELRSIGASGYYDRFPLLSAADYLSKIQDA